MMSNKPHSSSSWVCYINVYKYTSKYKDIPTVFTHTKNSLFVIPLCALAICCSIIYNGFMTSSSPSSISKVDQVPNVDQSNNQDLQKP